MANVTQQAGSPATASEWAALVLKDGGVPQTQQNINNMLVWMSNEEPTSNWSDRNNPLNASLGTSASDGTGSYPDLNTGAFYTAKMIFGQSNMISIANALATGTASSQTFGQAVINSPWASSHYGYDVSRFTGKAPSGSTPATPGSNSGTGSSGGVSVLGQTILSGGQLNGLLGGVLIAAGGLTLVIGVAFIAAYGLKRTGALNVVGAFPGPVGTTAKAVSSGGKSVGQAASAKRAETARQQRRAENTTDAETRAAAKRYASSGSRQVSGVPKSSKPSANRGRNERAKSIPRREGYDSVPF